MTGTRSRGQTCPDISECRNFPIPSVFPYMSAALVKGRHNFLQRSFSRSQDISHHPEVEILRNYHGSLRLLGSTSQPGDRCNNPCYHLFRNLMELNGIR